MVSLGTLDLFELDESLSYSDSVTKKPVEDKEGVADNIKLNPVQISITFNVNKDAYNYKNKLQNLRLERKPFTYTGVDEVYENMVLESLTIPRNVNILDGFEGSLKMSQIDVATQEVIRQELTGDDPVTVVEVRKPKGDVTERSNRVGQIEETDQYFNSVLGFEETAIPV